MIYENNTRILSKLVAILLIASFIGIFYTKPANAKIVTSRPVAEAAVRRAYQECLGRSPESAGLTHHVNLIMGGRSISGIHTDICNSQEAQNYRASGTSSTTSTTGSGSVSQTLAAIPAPACPFTSGTNRYVVNFGRYLRADTIADSSHLVSTNLPAGIYTIRMFTWDPHSVRGDQNQHNEIAALSLINLNGSILHTTNNTSDIPANRDSITSTITSNVTIDQTIRQIRYFHPSYPSNNPGSHTPICAEFVRTPIATPPVTPTPAINASCNVSRTRISEGDSITFDADITGGTGSYTVNWTGDVNRISGFNRTSRTQTVRINNSGRYFINLEVTDSAGRRTTDTCPVIVVDEDYRDNNLNVQCEISRSTIDRGDFVDIEVFTSGGTRPYYIDWSGDARLISGFNRTSVSQRLRINDVGTYRLRVDVEDRNGNTGTDYCTIRVRSTGGTGNINVITSSPLPDGELAGLSSVFLNQVPYTGPEDILKIIGFISFILIWSGAIGFYFLKDKRKKDISKKVSAFKEANRIRVIVD